jgi:hypothetical protein
MKLVRLLPLPFIAIILSCGKKAPPEPPVLNTNKEAPSGEGKAPARGSGGYLKTARGVALYWSFPIEVDYSEVYLGDKPLGRTTDFSFIYTGKLEKKITFKVVGYKNGKPVAEVLIEVNP